jgi:hypothetical protein
MKPKNAFKRKSEIKTSLEFLSLDMARKHLGSKFLKLKNVIGEDAKDLKPSEVKKINTITTIEGFIGRVGAKPLVSSANANDMGLCEVYVFGEPAYELFSVEQNSESQSFFEMDEKIYTLTNHKIYKTNELNCICLYLSLKTA